MAGTVNDAVAQTMREAEADVVFLRKTLARRREAKETAVKMRSEPLKARGVSRDAEEPRAVIVHFSRSLTDAELRFFHDVCGRTAPLMDGATDDV